MSTTPNFYPSNKRMILEVGQTKSFPRPLPDTDNKRPPSLLDLPYELRQSIFKHALRQKGPVELQYPVWAGHEVFVQPLFQTCRALRDEALDAFYECNDFLWIIDSEHQLRSDPATYLSSDPVAINGRYVQPELQMPLTGCYPWEYPRLMKNLRHLQINVYLPTERNASALGDRLRDLVKKLDRGERLAACHVLVTARRRAAQIPLTDSERSALEALAEMEVRGRVTVQARYYFKAVAAGVQSLNLQRRMKA